MVPLGSLNCQYIFGQHISVCLERKIKTFSKTFDDYDLNFEISGIQTNAYFVGPRESFPMMLELLKSVSIQPRTDRLKLGVRGCPENPPAPGCAARMAFSRLTSFSVAKLKAMSTHIAVVSHQRINCGTNFQTCPALRSASACQEQVRASSNWPNLLDHFSSV